MKLGSEESISETVDKRKERGRQAKWQVVQIWKESKKKKKKGSLEIENEAHKGTGKGQWGQLWNSLTSLLAEGRCEVVMCSVVLVQARHDLKGQSFFFFKRDIFEGNFQESVNLLSLVFWEM